MRLVVIAMAILGISYAAVAQGNERANFELSTGVSMLLYQSAFSYQPSTAVETALRGHVIPLIDWQVGARLGVSPILPEGFARLLAVPEIGVWRPSVGLELGMTNRARFKEGKKLLRETRTAMEEDISHIYVAGYATPLSFGAWKHWRVNALELQIGTHLGHTGRTTRVQLGIISIGRTL